MLKPIKKYQDLRHTVAIKGFFLSVSLSACGGLLRVNTHDVSCCSLTCSLIMLRCAETVQLLHGIALKGASISNKYSLLGELLQPPGAFCSLG